MANMEALIPVINRLQDVFTTLGGLEPIDLPQIVVIGAQSSGKSSVLEHIVGRDFLPRGSGIVTRRPLVLQCINTPKGKGAYEEWGEFLHKPEQLYPDFAKIRDEIDNETARVVGKGKGISRVPINLKIFSPNVLNLTLVDLPGMTRVPVGDQPPDIEHQIRKMLMEYIAKKNAVILAVSAGNADIATSDALRLAKEVDPEGVRTLGVITKIDIMDKGTDALDLLLGKVVPLRLGYVGVVLRSQEDIKMNLPIREALKRESKFFQSHVLYRQIASRCGTEYLTKTLNKVLMNHIRDCLPELKVKVSKMLTETQTELQSYGDSAFDGSGSQGGLLLDVITKFSNDYKRTIEGTSGNLTVHELHGGARINFIFNDIFAECLNRINPLEGLTHNDIRTAIRNATGPKAALFVPEAAFELLVKRQIMRLEEPSLQCVDYVFDELQRTVNQLESKELQRFGKLRERVVEVTNDLLRKCRTPTKQMITNLVCVEMSYINTSHPDFVGGGGAFYKIFENMAAQQQQAGPQPVDPNSQQPGPQPIQQQRPGPGGPGGPTGPGGPGGRPGNPNAGPGGPGGPQRRAPNPNAPPQQGGAQGGGGGGGGFFSVYFGKGGDNNQNQSSSSKKGGPERVEKLSTVPSQITPGRSQTDKEKFECELIQTLLKSYFDIVRKNIKDLTPKTIMHFLVNRSKDSMQNELVGALYREDMFESLLEESPLVAERRKQCMKMLQTLRRANEILNEVRDFAIK